MGTPADVNPILLVILSSTVASTFIIAVKELILWSLNRRAKKSDEDTEEDMRMKEVTDRLIASEETTIKLIDLMEKFDVKLDISLHSSKVLLHDRIKFLAFKYLDAGEISFEDKKLIHEMYGVYKQEQGNGDIQQLMELVDELPLIHGRHREEKVV